MCVLRIGRGTATGASGRARRTEARCGSLAAVCDVATAGAEAPGTGDTGSQPAARLTAAGVCHAHDLSPGAEAQRAAY